jgi:hypothetical protein
MTATGVGRRFAVLLLLVLALVGALLMSEGGCFRGQAGEVRQVGKPIPAVQPAEPAPGGQVRGPTGDADGRVREGVQAEVGASVGGTDTAAERKTEWQAHLDGVLGYDREIAAKFDLPPDKLKTASTEELASYFFAGPMPGGWFLLYDDPNKGIERALRASATLLEVTNREDLVEGIAAMCAHTDIESVLRLEEAGERGRVSMSLFWADQFLIYPPVFARTKGKEKELLPLLCDRYRRMSAVNRAKPENPPYGAVFSTTKQLAMSLIRSLGEQGKVNWRKFDIRDEEAFYTAIEQFLRSP